MFSSLRLGVHSMKIVLNCVFPIGTGQAYRRPHGEGESEAGSGCNEGKAMRRDLAVFVILA